jgi:HD-like signal output (HDOD) protein/FixJ family two-component response regulator
MTDHRKLRALVVDDELAVQKLLILALGHQGFKCDHAIDGIEAEARIAANKYDVVVTDLRMPNKHGHALATQLLDLDERPVIVIYTGVIEPRLAKDLLARGVDDILFKPLDFSILGVKVKALVDRRRTAEPQAEPPQSANNHAADLARLCLGSSSPLEGPIPLSDVASKLAGLSRLLPISKGALDVYNMTCTDEWDTPQLAAAIQRDASLTAEVLRLANSEFYNPGEQRIIQLERAVVQIGQKRIGELALAINSLTVLTSAIVPWMDTTAAWKQSMAAGIAAEMLIEQGRHQQFEAGLQLSAIMHPLGRVILGSLYPKQYEIMLKRCKDNDETLQEQERRMFPLTHAEIASQLLATWNVPAEVHLPLKSLQDDYRSLCKLSDPTRLKAEIVKLASLIGRLSVGQWEAWDVVELPPVALLKRLGIRCLSEIIDQTRRDIEVLTTFRTDRPAVDKAAATPTLVRELAYCDLSGAYADFLGALLPSMGIKPLPYAKEDLNDLDENILVNCIDAEPHPSAARLRSSSHSCLSIVASASQADRFVGFGQTIVLPISYGRLRTACWKLSRPIPPLEAGSPIVFLATVLRSATSA